MTRNKKILLAGLAAVLVSVAAWGYRSYLQNRGVPVQITHAVRRDLVAVVTASGEIKPRNYINIGAESMGRITDIYVLEGDRVKKGQVLARLESTQPAAEVAAQQAQLELTRSELSAAEAAVESNTAQQKTREATLQRARAELERAKINFERASDLLEERLIARQEYDQRRADLEAAKAAVDEARAALAELDVRRRQLRAQRASAGSRIQQAKAQLRRARDMLRRHAAVSPIEGIVTNLPVRVGETVVPGIQNSPASLIMTIADMSLITAEVKVDETDIVNVRLGQQGGVTIDAEPGRKIPGEVIEIGNTAILRTTGLAASQSTLASQEAKDFKVVVALDKPPETIRPGMSCTARITTASVRDVLTIPIQAITVRQASDVAAAGNPQDASGSDSADAREVEGVFVVENDVVAFRPLRIGITGSSQIEVLEGLSEGEEIVAGPYSVLRTIRSGARVAPDRAANEGE